MRKISGRKLSDKELNEVGGGYKFDHPMRDEIMLTQEEAAEIREVVREVCGEDVVIPADRWLPTFLFNLKIIIDILKERGYEFQGYE